jgi:hypothetical protein
LDFNGMSITWLGPLSDEAQRGMYLHPTDAVSVDPAGLGLARTLRNDDDSRLRATRLVALSGMLRLRTSPGHRRPGSMATAPSR